MSQLSGRSFNFENQNKFQVHEQGLQAGFDRRGHRGVRRVERLLRQPGEDQDHVCRRQLNIFLEKKNIFHFYFHFLSSLTFFIVQVFRRVQNLLHLIK